MPDSRDPFKYLCDPLNERALVHQAITDYPAYSRHGIVPDDYHRPLAATLALLAAEMWERFGPPDAPVSRLCALGRDRGVLTAEQETVVLDDFMDRPLGTDPDPERLKRHRDLRNLREALLRAVVRLEAGEPDRAHAVLEDARQEAHRRLAEAVSVESAPEFVHGWLEQVESATDEGISVGLPRLKSVIGNMVPGSVLVVGAGTNVGKSAFAAEVMLHAAKDGTPAGLISLEDPKLITVSRLVSAFAGVSPQTLMRGKEPERRHHGCLALVEYGESIFLSECLSGNEQHVAARMSVMAQRGAKLVIVDYIGEVQASAPQQDRRNEVRWVMSRLKAHAARIGVALIVCSQLSRPKDHDPAREPTKHDLKEAGDLENSAEYIVLMWREQEHDFAPVNLKLAKGKMGGNGAKWLMQRELEREGPRGERLPGSARLREVVRDRSRPADRDYPLVIDDYEARLAALSR